MLTTFFCFNYNYGSLFLYISGIVIIYHWQNITRHKTVNQFLAIVSIWSGRLCDGEEIIFVYNFRRTFDIYVTLYPRILIFPYAWHVRLITSYDVSTAPYAIVHTRYIYAWRRVIAGKTNGRPQKSFQILRPVVDEFENYREQIG